MHKLTARLLVVAIFLAPLTARADWIGCLIGPSETERCSFGGLPAAVLGAGAVATLFAGAAVTVQHERARAREQYPAGTLAGRGKVPPSLLLLPPAYDPFAPTEIEPAEAELQRGQRAHAQMVRINEDITNAMIGVTGAAVLGAVIANVAKMAKGK
jgi:hypothetical protein